MITVRPPEYLPGLAYVALMQSVECVVLADTFQYSRQSFQNRARLRTPQGWQWISVPLKGGQHGTPICDARIEQGELWGRRHWRALQYNYGRAPFFPHYGEAFYKLFAQEWVRLGDLTCASVELLHRQLGLRSRLVRASALEGRPASLPDVLRVMGTPPLRVPEEAARHDNVVAPGVEVFSYRDPLYRQTFDGFFPGMSAVDLLFNYGPEASGILRQSAPSGNGGSGPTLGGRER